jgi:hypothetical protein
MVALIFLFLGVVLALWWVGGVQEGFAYKRNPCAEFKNCKTCADAGACGWCSDLKVCQPMAQDGFPIHTKDSSTIDLDSLGMADLRDIDVMTSPYTDEIRTLQNVQKTAPKSRIHICNPFGYITDSDKC